MLLPLPALAFVLKSAFIRSIRGICAEVFAFHPKQKPQPLGSRLAGSYLFSLLQNPVTLPETLHLSRYCAPVADGKAEVEAVRHPFQDIQTGKIVQIALFWLEKQWSESFEVILPNRPMVASERGNKSDRQTKLVEAAC